MNEKAKELTAIDKPDAPAEWRSRDQVDALAKRFQTMLPGQLNRDQALALAQYSAALDANPFRGEVYAFDDGRGGMALTEGYKLLVRWARRQCQFYDRYERLGQDELPKGSIGFKCYVLRDDAKGMLQMLVGAGANWKDAFDIAAQFAVGVVTQTDRQKRNGGAIPPPKGWTWEEVARKRALKNALNRAYGAPSPREIARETWMVGDVETASSDWPDGADMLPAERELIARANAMNRERQPSEVGTAEAFNDLFDGELPAQESNGNGLLSDHELIPDIEALELGEEFNDAAVRDLDFKHARHIVKTLENELGVGWGSRFSKTHLWKTLEAHQAAKAGEEMAQEEPLPVQLTT